MQVKQWWLGLAIIISAAIIGCGVFFASQPAPHIPFQTTLLLAFSSTVTILYAGSAALFLLGIKRFTPELKRAYITFCVGLFIIPLSELQVPIAVLIGPAGDSWLSKGGLLATFLIGFIALYVGIKLFADLYQIKSPWSKPWVITLTTLIAMVIGYFLPLGPIHESATQTRATAALLALNITLSGASALLLFEIRRRSTLSYRQAMNWLFWAMTSFSAVGLIIIVVVTQTGVHGWFSQNGLNEVIQILLAPILVQAAIEFNRINDTQPANSRGNLIDIIITTAQKASDITAIDPYLYQLRIVTAKMKPNQTLSPADTTRLIKTYQDLENYLTTREPVRRYTKTELRERLRNELKLGPSAFFDQLN